MDQNKPLSPLARKTGPAASQIAPSAMAGMNYHFLRKSLLTFGAGIVLSVILVGISQTILIKLDETGTRLQQQMNEVQGRFNQAETEKMEVRDFQPKFIQLRERGFIGEEKRLDWMEHIKHIHESRKLLPLTYEISAQLPFQVDPMVMNDELELRGSKISLHMDLLHEADLFNFLEDLKNKTYYAPLECTLKREPVVANAKELSRTLSADCTLYWLTIAERNADAAQVRGTSGE